MTVQQAVRMRPSRPITQSDEILITETNEASHAGSSLPQSLSGVFDQSFDLYKRHFKPLALITAILYFPTQIILHGIFNTWLLPILAHLQTPAGSGDLDSILIAIFGILLVGVPEYGIPGFMTLVTFAIMSGPICVAASDIYFGRFPDVKESYRRSRKTIPRLVLSWMLAGLICLGIGVLCLVGIFLALIFIGVIISFASLTPTIGSSITVVALLVGAVATYLICMATIARFCLFVTPLVVLERLSLVEVWNRNYQMVGRLRFRHSWAAAAALPVVVFGLQYLILLSASNTIRNLQLSPLIEFSVNTGSTALIALFFQPYMMVFVTMLYYDYRVRGEGFDLVLLSADSLNLERSDDKHTGVARPHNLLTLILFCTLLGSSFCHQTAMAQPPSNATMTTTQVKSDLKEILKQPEFQPESSQPGPIAETLDKVKAQLQSWWNRIKNFFNGLFHGSGGGMGSVSVALTYTLIAILALIGIWAIIRVLANYGGLRRQKQNAVRAVATDKADGDGPQLAPDEWIEQANRYAQGNDFRAAFRAVFLAILVQLDRSGEIEYQRSRTNGDYMRLLRTRNLLAIYDFFAPLAREFDRHWYGGYPSDESDYQRCLAAYHNLPGIIVRSLTASQATTDFPAERN